MKYLGLLFCLALGFSLSSFDFKSTASQNIEKSYVPRIVIEVPPIPAERMYSQMLYGLLNTRSLCERQPMVAFCIDKDYTVETLVENDIKALDAWARKDWTYKNDIVDAWNVNTLDVVENNPWTGDCDDLSSTVADMLIRAGHPKGKIWMVLMAAAPINQLEGRLDHLVTVVEDNTGKHWVVGDTNGRVYPIQQANYRPIAFVNLEKLEWTSAETSDYADTFLNYMK